VNETSDTPVTDMVRAALESAQATLTSISDRGGHPLFGMVGRAMEPGPRSTYQPPPRKSASDGSLVDMVRNAVRSVERT
jgi:hypothetical protein